jgi:hypothetical protein
MLLRGAGLTEGVHTLLLAAALLPTVLGLVAKPCCLPAWARTFAPDARAMIEC